MEAYTTLRSDAEARYEEKKSVFIGNARPVASEEEAQMFLSQIKKRYPDARHHVYAYVLRSGSIVRFSDDHEPSGTAGIPVLDVMRKAGITDAVIVVTRYFGGTLLGAAGLVRAYTEAAARAVRAAQPVTRLPFCELQVQMPYALYPRLQTFFSDPEFRIADRAFEEQVRIRFSFPATRLSEVTEMLSELSAGKAMILDRSEHYDFLDVTS